MGEWTQAERYLLEQIRAGSNEAWSQLVERYEGRLVSFARSRGVKEADAEDIVQETFLLFLRGLADFRAQASLETYLFVILRRRVIEHFRGKRSNVCQLQDSAGGESVEARLPASDPTASWYVRRDENRESARAALTGALKGLIEGMKDSLNFRDLQIVEMLFYAQVRNKDIAAITGTDEKFIALVKHRWLKQLRERLAPAATSGAFLASDSRDAFDSLLTEIWEQERPSCPKRSTVGGYLLGTLDTPWHDYVEFHTTRLGCAFCKANLDDLRRQTTDEPRVLRDRILQSTVGFFKKP